MAKLCVNGEIHNGICKHLETVSIPNDNPEIEGDTTEEKVWVTYDIKATLKASSKMNSNGNIVLNGDPVMITGCPHCTTGIVKSITTKKIKIDNKVPISIGDIIQYDGGTITINSARSKINV